MPMYEYVCRSCEIVVETYRPMAERNVEMVCPKGHVFERIASVPALSIWDASRPFLNSVKSGDGTFPTRAAYETHLKMNGLAECKTDGKIYRPHGNRVVRHGKAESPG